VHELRHAAGGVRRSPRTRRGVILVLVVTDNGFAAEAVRSALQHASGLQVAGYVDGRRSCAAAVNGSQPDVVIVDEMTWSACAVERIRELRVSAPSSKVIALASEPGAAWLADAAAAGAHAAIAKTVHPRMLGPLVREIWAGNVHHAFDPPHLASAHQANHRNLTPRELETLRLVANGSANNSIARRLCVTEQTVKFHLSNVYRKLGVSNRTQAGHYAYVHRLVSPSALPAPDGREAA
jgi:DNA-binding NarL/FixJ family response regulator